MKFLPFFLQVPAMFAVIGSAAAESDSGFYLYTLRDTGEYGSLPLDYPQENWYPGFLEQADSLSICWYCITRNDPDQYCQNDPTIKKVDLTLYDSNDQVLATRSETASPYCLGGDSGGTIFPVPALLTQGDFRVKVEAYNDDSDDIVDFTLEQSFTYTDLSKVHSYMLWDATTNEPIEIIPSILDVDRIVLERGAFTQFNIEAVVEGLYPDAVQITLLDNDGDIIRDRTETRFPYMLGGDSGVDNIFSIPELFRGRVFSYRLETSILLGGVWLEQDPQTIEFRALSQSCEVFGEPKCSGFAGTNKASESCWCDDLCQSFDDCCFNYEDLCLI